MIRPAEESARSYPLGWLRDQFPALSAANGDRIFLNNASGSQVPQGVIDATVRTMVEMNVNKGGAYRASQRVTAAKEDVREQVAEFLGAPSARSVSFGPNATTLLELLAQGVGRMLETGDEIIVSGLEHHANRNPWRQLSARAAVIKTWEVRGDEARLDLRDLDALLTPKTQLVALSAASNALGTVPEVAAAAARVHAAGARLMVEAVHSAPHALPDVQALGADLLVFSPYKVFGPHLGVLYLSDEMLDTLPAPTLSFLDAGTPIAWEPGTQNTKPSSVSVGPSTIWTRRCGSSGSAARVGRRGAGSSGRSPSTRRGFLSACWTA